MTNKVLLGLIVALAIGVVVVGSNDKARQQPAAAITAVSKTTIDSKSDTVGEGEARPATTTDNQPQDISIFTALTEAVDLTAILEERGGTYTVFAPNDRAFEMLTGGDERTVLAVYTRQQLIDLLSYHVVSGRYDSRELSDGLTLTTINGGTLTIGQRDGQKVINDTAVVVSSEETSEGSMVHILDGVLQQERALSAEDIGAVKGEEGNDGVQTVCTDMKDGTMTLQKQERKKIFGIVWGSWQNSGESVVQKGSCKGMDGVVISVGGVTEGRVKHRDWCQATGNQTTQGIQSFDGFWFIGIGFGSWEFAPGSSTFTFSSTEAAQQHCDEYNDGKRWWWVYA